MDELRRTLGRVRSRMLLAGLLALLPLALAAAWGAAALGLLAHRLVFLPLLSGWAPVLLATLAGLASAAALAYLRRPTLSGAALRADEALGLSERLSSALSVSGADPSPMEALVLEDARRHLPRVVPARVAPAVPSRRRMLLAGSSLAALLGAFLLPDYDLLRRRSGEEARRKELLKVQAAGKAVEKTIVDLREAAERKAPESGEIGKALEALAKDLQDGIKTPEAALAEVNDLRARLQEQMEQFQDRSRAELAKDLQKALEEARREAGSDSREDALKELQKQLEEAAKRAEEGKASPEELAKLQEQLSKLAEAMKKEGGDRLSEELAKAAEALKKEGNQALADQLKELAGELGKMGEALGQEEMQEMLQAELDDLRRQLGGQEDPWAAEAGPGSGQGQEGQPGNKPGEGMGPGIGEGARPEGELGEHAFERTKVKTKQGEGEILGSFFVKGVPPKGSEKAEYVDRLGEYRQEAAKALEKETIPAEDRERVRRYFDSLKPEP